MKAASNLLLCILFSVSTPAQVLTEWIDSTTHPQADVALFFTNRPIEYKEDGSVTFKNKSNKQTNDLYFCMFDYESDTIHLKYRAENPSGNFPVSEVKNNFLYKAMRDIRNNRGITRFYFVIPGYAKTFESQVYDFMYRLKTQYGDALINSTAINMFAWGDEWRSYRYYAAKQSARRAANDFAIFQHLLDELMSDTAYIRKYLNDIEVNLLCTSMGNQLLKKYLQEREKQGIPLVKTYNNVTFIGSDAAWDSFEKGKGFDHIDQLADSVRVFVNYRDGPLHFSQRLNPKPRMGLMGPKNPETLPDFIRIYLVTRVVGKEDLPAMGHDYLLRNPVVLESFRQDVEFRQATQRMQ